MNQGKVLLLFLAIFIALTLTPFPKVAAQAAGPQITASQPIYPIWHVGGQANLTASRLTINATYYLFFQRPGDPFSRFSGTGLLGRNGTIPFQIPVAAADPPGTYLVSLSTSETSDTRTAVAHFGVIGTDANNYSRLNTMQIAGGGFTPNSTITVALRSGVLPAGNFSFKVDAKGNYKNAYKLPPSIPLGPVTVTVVGPAFDSGRPVSATTSMMVATTFVTVSPSTQPAATVERTTNSTMSLKITYLDGSPVTTATQNSTRIFIVSDTGGSTATEVQLTISNPSTGEWTASWRPSFSASLGSFHFEIFPADFDDRYGNKGRGIAVTSTSFQVTPAHADLSVQSNSSIQRTLAADVVIVPRYHDGNSFQNVTQASGTVTVGNRTVVPIIFNATLGEFVSHYKTNSSTPLGPLSVSATVRDLFGNTATGSFKVQIVPAVLTFKVALNATTQRTTLMNVTARLTYPDGSLITANNLPSGFNATVRLGNLTWSHAMDFNSTTNDWGTGYRVSQNATLGNYAVAMNTTDPFGNAGQYSGVSKVIPATFKFELPLVKMKASPHTTITINANVFYPNGSALTPGVGGVVTASFSNSSGTFTLPMYFNSTDRTWILTFLVPDPGLRFGLTLTFSFSANDQFGNAGAVAQAFELDIGAGVQTLILATMIGAIPPIALIGWAIATVSARRRKHKP